jgi:hypothetical protein
MQTTRPLSKTAIEALSRALVGGYSNTSKMPCRAWSISAYDCHTGSKLAAIAGTVCEECYARKNFYSMPNVQTALHKRFATAVDLEQWTRNHIKLIPLVETSGYFRWFDSGDLQSIAMLDAIATIARALPGIKFWLPTKEHAFVAAWIRQGNTVPRESHNPPISIQDRRKSSRNRKQARCPRIHCQRHNRSTVQRTETGQRLPRLPRLLVQSSPQHQLHETLNHQPYQAMISIKNSTGSYQIDSAQIVTGTLADYDQINDIVGMISEDEQEYLRIIGKIVMELNDPYTFGDVYRAAMDA